MVSLPSPPIRRHFSHLAIAALALTAAPALHTAVAQQPEFTRQGVLVTTFTTAPGTDHRLGRKSADAVRSRIGKLSDKHQTEVIDGYTIAGRLLRDGFDPDSALMPIDLRLLAQETRADEFVVGRVDAPRDRPVRIEADLYLVRYQNIRQPLPAVTGTDVGEAAEAMARNVVAARAQAMPMRRCENALREGHGRQALAAARAGLEAYPRGVAVGTCLVWALRATGAPADELLAASQSVLAIDSTNAHALENAAVALDTLRRRDDAATMWLRLARTQPTDLELSSRVVFALLQGKNARHADPFVSALSDAHPEHATLLWYKWRAAVESRAWQHAAEAGEALLARDSLARADSLIYLRLATAYRALGNPYKAVEIVARGVARFPSDPTLYALYAQFVRAEADTVLPRGLALFPRSADLLALNAQALRARGKLAESLEASRQAMWTDSTLSQSELLVAQTEMELNQPDSAFATLRLALSRGKDSTLVANFLLAKGNTLYRAAGASKLSGDFERAVRFLALADSVRPSAQSRFLLGAAALGTAQSALTEAPQLTPQVHAATAAATRDRSCQLARLGTAMLEVARGGLAAGAEIGASGASESLGYVDQLAPYAAKEMAAYCPGAPAESAERSGGP